MSEERRILSLMNWIRMLKQDIDIQQRSKDGLFHLIIVYSHFFWLETWWTKRVRCLCFLLFPFDILKKEIKLCYSIAIDTPAKVEINRDVSSSSDEDGAMHHRSSKRKGSCSIQWTLFTLSFNISIMYSIALDIHQYRCLRTMDCCSCFGFFSLALYENFLIDVFTD